MESRSAVQRTSNGFLLRGLQVRILLGSPMKTLDSKGFFANFVLFFGSKLCCQLVRAYSNKIKLLRLSTTCSEQHESSTAVQFSFSAIAHRRALRFDGCACPPSPAAATPNAWTAGTSTTEVNVELTELEILILRGLLAKPALDIPGGIVNDNMSELIDIGYISVRTVGNLFSYEITDAGRASLASGV
jgi:hypothetical protein